MKEGQTVLIILAVLVAWVAIVVFGVRTAKKKNRSPHWMWFGVHPASGLVALLVLLLVKPLRVCENCRRCVSQGVPTCPVCQHTLGQPAETKLDLPVPSQPFWTGGKFRKVRFKSLATAGQYRGQGQLAVGEEGLEITGRHVHSMGGRWGMALGIFCATLILSLASTSGGYLLLIGPVPLYLIVEYAWLKREEQRIAWSAVRRFTTDPAQRLVAIEFEGPDWTSPVVLETERWPEVAAWLRQRVPGGEIPAHASGAVRSGGWRVALVVLVVIMLIGIFAAIAIPNLLEARRRAEAARSPVAVPAEAVP